MHDGVRPGHQLVEGRGPIRQVDLDPMAPIVATNPTNPTGWRWRAWRGGKPGAAGDDRPHPAHRSGRARTPPDVAAAADRCRTGRHRASGPGRTLFSGLPGRHDGTVRLRPEPVSPAGAHAWQLADELARSWEPSAAARDRAGRFDPALVQEIRRSGLTGCTAPTELGGGGLDRLSDLMAVIHRLAVADGSLALVVQMHLSGVWGLARSWRADPDPQRAVLLSAVASGRAWLCAAVTEAGTNFFHPRAVLRAGTDGGWVLEGTKVFATGSPAATHFSANTRVEGGPLDGRLAQVVVPADADGVHIEDNWDGLGMRASGSGVVRFESVHLGPSSIVQPGGPYGVFTAGALCGRAFGNVGNVTAMAGLACAAEELARKRVTTRSRVDAAPLAHRATVRQALAELQTDAYALAAVVGRLGRRSDEVADALQDDPASVDEARAREFMAEFQAAKLNVNRLACRVVDAALALAGGSGYTGADPLGRLARDVRAGLFMQPFSPHEGLGFIGAVAAGVDPDVLA